MRPNGELVAYVMAERLREAEAYRLAKQARSGRVLREHGRARSRLTAMLAALAPRHGRHPPVMLPRTAVAG